MTKNQIREKFSSIHHFSFGRNICHFEASGDQKPMKVDDMIRLIHTTLSIFDKMDIPNRPRISPYLNHRIRTDLNVWLLRIFNLFTDRWTFNDQKWRKIQRDFQSVVLRRLISVENPCLSKVKLPFVHCHYSPDE